jgi:hypothetical protein
VGREYNFCFLGGPNDGRTERRRLSREESFDFLGRVSKQGVPRPRLSVGEEPHYELVDFKDGMFYFEWLKLE